jgi:hypothetical protein
MQSLPEVIFRIVELSQAAHCWYKSYGSSPYMANSSAILSVDYMSISQALAILLSPDAPGKGYVVSPCGLCFASEISPAAGRKR